MRPFLTRTAGERKLPGGRAFLLLVIAGATVLAACGQTVTSGNAPTQGSVSTPAATSSSRFPPVPTNGGPAATGLILPSYFVTVLESSYGALTVLTTPGSSCTLSVVMPDGSRRADAELRAPRTTDSGGRTTFSYPATAATAGVGIQTVVCELAGQREQAQAKFEVK